MKRIAQIVLFTFITAWAVYSWGRFYARIDWHEMFSKHNAPLTPPPFPTKAWKDRGDEIKPVIWSVTLNESRTFITYQVNLWENGNIIYNHYYASAIDTTQKGVNDSMYELISQDMENYYELYEKARFK